MDTCYIISYDMAEGGDYDALFTVIKALGAWAKITESTWAVVTQSAAVGVRDALRVHLPDGSRLFVVKSGVEAAWFNSRCEDEWLKSNL